MRQAFQERQAFGILVAILLLLIFSLISLTIIETKIFSDNIDKYKYYHLQSKLHLEYIEKYILENKQIPSINIWDNNNEKYILSVTISNDGKEFDIFITPKEDIEVRVHRRVMIN